MAEPSKPWSAAMAGFLVRMRRRGKPYWWIAKALGVSRNALVGRAAKMGLLFGLPQTRVAAAPVQGEPPPLGDVRIVLGPGVCHWISGDVADADWRMCGHEAAEGGVWCVHHRARVYAPVATESAQERPTKAA